MCLGYDGELEGQQDILLKGLALLKLLWSWKCFFSPPLGNRTVCQVQIKAQKGIHLWSYMLSITNWQFNRIPQTSSGHGSDLEASAITACLWGEPISRSESSWKYLSAFHQKGWIMSVISKEKFYSLIKQTFKSSSKMCWMIVLTLALFFIHPRGCRQMCA